MRPNIEEIRKDWKIENPDLVVNEQRTINQLLAYIDELENMPLVQTVVKLQEENERLQANNLIDHINELWKLNVCLRKENEQLREVLLEIRIKSSCDGAGRDMSKINMLASQTLTLDKLETKPENVTQTIEGDSK